MSGFVGGGVLAMLRRDQLASMNDTCELYAHGVGSVDAYGKPADTYTLSETTLCGVEHGNEDGVGANVTEALGKTEVPRATLKLRLPLMVSVDQLARVKVTHRHGSALVAAELYEVVGLPQRGPGAFVAEIRRELVTQ